MEGTEPQRKTAELRVERGLVCTSPHKPLHRDMTDSCVGGNPGATTTSTTLASGPTGHFPDSGPSGDRINPNSRPSLRRRQSWLDDLLPPETWTDSIQALFNYLALFDWSRTFWKPTNGSQTMHVLCTQGKDGSRGIVQIWLVGRIEFATLVMQKLRYSCVKVGISR